MGDTGSLGLGGAIAGLAVMTRTEILLVLLGGIFVVEALSVDDPGLRVPDLPQAGLPDGADPPPLRADVVVGDEDHPALLDRGHRPRGDRLHDLPAVRSLDACPSRPPGPISSSASLAPGRALLELLGDRAAWESDRRQGDDTPVALRVVEALRRIKSPGVPQDAPVIVAARERGMPVIGEVELAWRLLPNEFVGVTGTNGKTTTIELLGAIHREAGVAVAVAGNVGTPLTSLVGKLDPGAVVVCELSSFQLEDTVAFAPEGAVLLNLAPDHLDRHGTFEDYQAAKLQIFARQGQRRRRRRAGRAGRRGPRRLRAPRLLRPAAASWTTAPAQLWWDDEPLIAPRRDPPARRPQPGQRRGRRGGRPGARHRARRGPRGAADVRRRRAPARGGRRRSTASSTSTTPRRPTSTRRSWRSRASTQPVHLILGGGGKGQDFTPLREPARPLRAACI